MERTLVCLGPPVPQYSMVHLEGQIPGEKSMISFTRGAGPGHSTEQKAAESPGGPWSEDGHPRMAIWSIIRGRRNCSPEGKQALWVVLWPQSFGE